MQHEAKQVAVPTAITFELYSSDEIRKMSVVEVVTPLSISATGQGLPGGLYDPQMGPHSQFGKCLTCQKNLMHCSGHFGHIELPLPVINPLFNKTVLQIFRLSCINCKSVIVPGALKCMTVTQLRLLSHGLVNAAMNAEFIMVELTGGTDKESKRKGVAEADLELAQASEEANQRTGTTAAGDWLRQKIVQKILRLAKMNYKCPFCSTVCRRMTQSESKILYSQVKSEASRRSLKGFRGDVEEDNQDEAASVSGTRQKYLTPLEAKNHMRAVWAREKDFLQYVFPVLQTTKADFPTDVFFIDVLPVTPPKNRPSQTVNNILMEHPHNLAFRHVVTSCAVIQYILRAMSNGMNSLSDESQKVLKGIQGTSLEEKLEQSWNQLQADVDHVMDRDRNAGGNQLTSQMIGLKQIIERKEGLFRMNMMGKRVNYAARTVITPDPNITIDEIGIPDVFAKVLTYPCTVTPASVYCLRKLVLNGPNCYPGAVAVRDENGVMTRLHPTDQAQREGVANRLLVSDPLKQSAFTGVKTVYRHLQNGDMLLLNRQPSLHRPSIMAHRARVLQGEKVFRLHYANCKHYNADFDGDEMNAHFPQDEESRAEAATLVNVCNHFLVPKDGTPLGGLIQDHIVGAVKLTLRGRFFTEEDYHELVYFALSGNNRQILLEPPCMLKPVLLWSGKQVVSTIVKNLVPPGKPPLTFISMAKIKSKEWRQWESRPIRAGGALKDDEMSESVVIFRQGELLSGVLDKVHLGATAFGLCHAFYELYGSVAVGSLLSAFSKLLTNFLQWEGFTLGVRDVLVMPAADEIRKVYMEKASQVGPEASAKASGLGLSAPMEMIEKNLEAIHRSRDPKRRAIVDQSYKQTLDKFTNKINSTCLPYGLVSIFPHNNLQLLVQSGAKGSTVNTMQMSCLLGQIELEGKRPPLTLAGKSLPSFRPYDMSPRAGGFILGRFLTGIKPQEFFFHCMAGREGLIDTAVKTSRSGYLQRCLVKLLEGVVINYDMTVRDSDGSVIQFFYGEDGLDISKSQYLKSSQLPFLEQNADCVAGSHRKFSTDLIPEIDALKSKIRKSQSKAHSRRQSGFLSFCKSHRAEFGHESGFNEETGRPNRTEALIAKWRELNAEERGKHRRKAKENLDPVLGTFLPTTVGVVSEKLESTISAYSDDSRFRDVAYKKAMEALASPGDAVGVLAAQSLGEPSTQMTLNTFHFAGRGEMNVTLGIPRLREILMVASENIKTPCMDIPFKDPVTESEADQLRLKLTRVTMDQVLEQVNVEEKLDRFGNRIYRLKFIFLPYEEYADTFFVKPSTILKYFEKKFLSTSLLPAIYRAMKMRKSDEAVHTDVEGKQSGESNAEDESGEPITTTEETDDMYEQSNDDALGDAERRGQGEEHESSDEEEVQDDADATQSKRQTKQTDLGYEEPEEEEQSFLRDDNSDAEGPDISQSHINGDGLDNVEAGDNISSSKFSVSRTTKERRRGDVMAADSLIVDYNFDRKRQEWCEVTLEISHGSAKLNMGLLLQEVAKKSTIHQVANINRAFVSRKDERFYLRTEGINILAMAPFENILDLRKLHCNNIHKMAHHYGIEAALKVLIKELSDVFKVYGITIDPRHLSLIADYMTQSGTYLPFNRIGIAHSASPLHQMSFETVVNFLREATLAGKQDTLSNPSAQLIVGKPVHVGTDLFECHSTAQGSSKSVGLNKRRNPAAADYIYSSVSMRKSDWTPKGKKIINTN